MSQVQSLMLQVVCYYNKQFLHSKEEVVCLKTLLKTKEVNQFLMTEKDTPMLKEDELLIKVAYCGVCGSDVHAATHAKGYEFVPLPIILGHEFSGVVAQVGDKVDESYLHQAVIGVPGIFCGECVQCKQGEFAICDHLKVIGLHVDGAMAEYVKVTTDQIMIVPDGLPLSLAALTEPLSVATHAVARLEALEGKRILIQGCGIIGIFAALLLKHQGHEIVLSGLKKDWAYRLKVAESLGIPTIVADDHETDIGCFDVVFECSGSTTGTELIIPSINKAGILVLVALYDRDLHINVNHLVRSQINIVTSYGSNLTDYHAALRFIERHQIAVSKLIKAYSLEEGQQAFDDALAQKVLKPIIQINE